MAARTRQRLGATASSGTNLTVSVTNNCGYATVVRALPDATKARCLRSLEPPARGSGGGRPMRRTGGVNSLVAIPWFSITRPSEVVVWPVVLMCNQ
jgi:hypothetical protein